MGIINRQRINKQDLRKMTGTIFTIMGFVPDKDNREDGVTS
jgi:hypothetical protein